MSIWDDELGDAMSRGANPEEQPVLAWGTSQNGDEYRGEPKGALGSMG